MVQPWGPGILAQERRKFLSRQTLSRDWGRGSRDPHSCLLFSLWTFFPKCQQPLGPTSVRPSAMRNGDFPSHPSITRSALSMCLSSLAAISETFNLVSSSLILPQTFFCNLKADKDLR